MTYDVLLTKKDGRFVACVRQWPVIIVEGDTEEEALRKAQADLKSLLLEGRIVQLELDTKLEGHPWQQFVGMFADDPDWEAFQEAIQQYRKQIDHVSAED